MKRALNMAAELMALPYSKYMFKRDPVQSGLDKLGSKGNLASSLWNAEALGQVFDEECQYAVEYFNQFTEVTSLTELQSMFHYVFAAKDICALSAGLEKEFDAQEKQPVSDISPVPRDFRLRHNVYANQYYIQNIEKLAKTFLTIRSGNVVLRYWDGPEGAYFNQREPLPHADTVSRAKSAVSHSFQPERIESWHSLLQCIPEDLILCSFAAVLSDNGDINHRRSNSFEILRGFGDAACLADIQLDRVLNKGMAETHIHAGASRSFGMIWESMLDVLDKRIDKENGNTMEKDYFLSWKGAVMQDEMQALAFEAACIRLLLAAFLGNCGKDFFRFLDSGSLRAGYSAYLKAKVGELCKNNCVRQPFYSAFSRPGAVLKADSGRLDLWHVLQIPSTLRWPNPTLAERCFLTWALLHVRDVPTDYGFTAALLYYIRLKTTAYRCRVQDSKSKGLLYFQQYYELSTDTGGLKAEEKLIQIITTALQDPRVKKTELRIRPAFSAAETMERAKNDIEIEIRSYLKRFIKCHLYSLVCMYTGIPLSAKDPYKQFSDQYNVARRRIQLGASGAFLSLLKNMGVRPESIPSHRIGLVYHMIKRGEKGEKPSCFANSCEICPRCRMEKFSFGTARFQAQAAIEAISDIRDLCPALAGLIVGIDAASLEIPTEPWVFAPAFQQARARNAELAYNGRIAAKKPLLGITYHVGEDFRHPLSGLRHIDEAIDLFRLHSGDRIGHGLALGIDLERWFRLHRLIAVPRIEALENYLWAWSLLANESMTRKLAPFASLIESKIMDYANEIYGGLSGITIDSLYQAYIAKSLPTEEVQKIVQKWEGKEKPGCVSQLDTAKFFPCWTGKGDNSPNWNAEYLTLSYHCRFFKQRMNAPIMIMPAEDQLALTKELQLYLRKKAASIGLVIESNPSSNAVVGEIDGILKHPASVLRDCENIPVLTSINTDDPSVFNATMANEHAHIYYALRSAGYSVESALKTVDEMRETGFRSSFIGEVPTVETLLQEYETILRTL